MRLSRSSLRFSLSVLAAVAGLVLAPLAHAVSVTVNFTADIFFSEIGGPAVAGQTASGSFTYDSTTPDLHAFDPSESHFFEAITGGAVTVGGFSASYDNGFTDFWIYDDIVAGPGLADGFALDFGTTSNAVGGFTLTGLDFVMYTDSLATPSSVFTSDALPTASWPAAAAFDGYNSLVFKFTSSSNYYAYATVTSFSATAAPGVPEGGSVALLLAGAFGGLVALRRRARQG